MLLRACKNQRRFGHFSRVGDTLFRDVSDVVVPVIGDNVAQRVGGIVPRFCVKNVFHEWVRTLFDELAT